MGCFKEINSGSSIKLSYEQMIAVVKGDDILQNTELEHDKEERIWQIPENKVSCIFDAESLNEPNASEESSVKQNKSLIIFLKSNAVIMDK